MLKKYISFLRSPVTREKLKIKKNKLEDESGNKFEIINEIPRFVDKVNYSESFGFQWNLFDDVQIDNKNQYNISEDRFYENIGIKKHDLKNKKILEVGSGAGRFTEIFLNEKCNLFSIDYSSAVDANKLNNGSDFFLAQADIYKLPFEYNFFDYVICMGVIQHTPNVEESFNQMVKFVKPGGKIVIDVYGKNWKTIFYSRFWFRPITKRMNNARLLKIVEWYVPLWFPISSILLKIPLIGKFLAQIIPISNYSKQYPFMSKKDLVKWAILDTFDMLSPAYDNPQSISSLKKFAKNNNIKIEYCGKGHNGYVLRGKKI
jgi:ubiquinone/menaquinone biosynthesis C-methylase UbiE